MFNVQKFADEEHFFWQRIKAVMPKDEGNKPITFWLKFKLLSSPEMTALNREIYRNQEGDELEVDEGDLTNDPEEISAKEREELLELVVDWKDITGEDEEGKEKPIPFDRELFEVMLSAHWVLPAVKYAYIKRMSDVVEVKNFIKEKRNKTA